MADGSISPVYQRLSGVAPYHPFEADTFADWALEAGDMVTVSRGGTSYTSPIHSTSLVWRGQPKMHIVSSGKEKRDSIAKSSLKKYASRGGGMWNNQELYWELYSDDGQLSAMVKLTSSVISARMTDMYNGLMSYIELTAGHLLAQFWGLYDGLRSELELTRSRLYVMFEGLYDGLTSYMELTRSRMYVDFIGLYDGLNSQLEVTRSRIYVDFRGLYDGLSSQFEVTRSRLYVEFRGLYDGLSSQFELTRSRMYVSFVGLYDGLSSQFEVTRSRMYVEFNGMYDGLSSKFEVTRSRMYAEFIGLYDGLSSQFEVTRSRMYVDFKGAYDGLASSFEVTRSRMYVDFRGIYDGLASSFEVTRSRMYADFRGLYDGLGSQFEVTRSRMYVDFRGLYDGLSSSFEVTRSRMYVDFSGMYDGLSSQLEVTRSRLSYEVSNSYTQLSGRISAESNRIGLVVEGTGSNAHIKPAAIVAAINEDGTSQTRISADKVLIDGDTTLSGTLEIDDGALVVKRTAVFQGTGGRQVSINNGTVSANDVSVKAGGAVQFVGSQSGEYYNLQMSDVAGMIVKAEVDSSSNTLKLWKKGDAASSPSITFRKAASTFSGAWSGSRYNVTADQNGSTSIAMDIQTGTDGNGGDSFSILAQSREGSESVYTTRASQYLYVREVVNGASSKANVCTGSDGTGVIASVGTGSTYAAGQTNGQNGVTINKGAWSGGLVEFNKSAGTASRQEVRLSLSGVSWSGNTATVQIWDGQSADAQHGVYTGKDVVVDASGRYTAGETAGQNAVAINKGAWSGGQVQFTKSAGTASTKGVKVGLSGSWSGNTYSYSIKDYYDSSSGVDTGYSGSIDASARYNAGYDAGNSAGYSSGYSAGAAAGYNNGWNAFAEAIYKITPDAGNNHVGDYWNWRIWNNAGQVIASGQTDTRSNGMIVPTGGSTDVPNSLEMYGGTDPGSQYPWIGDVTSGSSDAWCAIKGTSGNILAKMRVMKADGGGSSHSVSLSVDIGWTGDVSGYTNKGSYSASSLARTYIRVSASCGGNSKKYYYTIN